MRNIILTLTAICSLLLSTNAETKLANASTYTLVELSQELLKAIKANKNTAELESTLKNIPMKRVHNELNTDHEKLAFWINIYNAFIQLKLNADPTLYENRGKFFGMKQIAIAGKMLSFEKIEHGVIRRSQKPSGLGYVKKIFPGRLERKLRVDQRDYRIHFALNCGAKSCPPVGIYSADKLYAELDYMTKTYLNNNTTYDKDKKVINTTTLFSWFRGDFGGIDGAKEILKEQGLMPSIDADIKFNKYDWTLLTNQFVDINI